MTEGEAAPTADGQGRNLLMRVAAALVLAPLTIAIAYAGGWLWAALEGAIAEYARRERRFGGLAAKTGS